MKLVHQTNPKGLHRLRFKLRGEEIVSCQKNESLKNTQRTWLVHKTIVINHQNILGINMPLHKCSRSTLTSSMHNFPITSLFEKLFRHERQVIYFFVFSLLKKNCMFHPQLNRNKKEKQNLLSEESKQAHTRISTPRYCSPATAPEKSLIIPKCKESL